MAGLATAARLADFGHQVTVCEQAATIGGQVASYTRDGFTFDAGPSLLTLPAVYRDLFRKTGSPLERSVEIAPADPAHRYRFADGTELDLPNASRAETQRVLDHALGRPAGEAWQSVVQHGSLVWQTVRSPFLEASPTRRDFVRLAASPNRLRVLAPGRSLRTLGQRLLPDPRLRLMLEHTVPGADPRQAPAALAAIPYVHQTFGRWLVRGGMGTLVRAVHNRAVECGASVRLATTVDQVSVTSGRVTGVRLADGEPIAADVVVASADTRRVLGGLLPGAARRRRPPRLSGSPSMFVLLLALHGHVPDLPHHTVLFPHDQGVDLGADAELDAVFGAEPSPPSDPTIDVIAPADPALRPAGGTRAWTVRVAVPGHGAVDWTAPGRSESYADHVLAAMAARGLDVRSTLAWRVVRTPYDLERLTGVPGGSAWGSTPDSVGSLVRRPGNRTPIRGLFLVGGSTYPGPGLPLVALSSMMVADLIGRA